MLNLALVGEQQSRVRDLSGFRKSHRVPDEDSERARAFVQRIATDDIGRDLDHWFADFRRQLGLKRAQLEVSEPDHGSGTITTPSFQYQVSVGFCENDPSTLLWRRCVSNFTTAEPMLADDFSATFGTTFDTIEFVPPDPIDVESFIDWIEEQPDSQLDPDYDRTTSWCRLLAPQNMASTMLIQTHLVSLKSLTPCPPRTLVKSFLAFRDLLPVIAWTGW